MDFCKPQLTDRSTWGNCSKLELYCKNVYHPTVKVTDWEQNSQSLPIDIDPYCPTAFNLHYSHYNKLGADASPINYTTTTQEMLAQRFVKRPELDINPNKSIINYLEIDNENQHGKQIVCSSPFGADFITTMQHSFQPPFPYLLKRLSMAEPPYFLHRYLKENKTGKFLDDYHMLHTQALQNYKSCKHISYNPCTGYYTDGTLGATSDIY